MFTGYQVTLVSVRLAVSHTNRSISVGKIIHARNIVAS